MAVTSSVRTINPRSLDRNPENPRLIFRAEDLDALEDSIKSQGILVPLTVYEDGKRTRILDGERRWRCALKLGLSTVPVIIQPKPDRLRNIMMMFAIPHARTDWDPLPTAYKLRDLSDLFTKQQGRQPSETELAELASTSRGEVRRLKKLLALPDEYQDELMAELNKPRHEQVLTVDLVLETTRGAEALQKRGLITQKEEDQLRKSIITKYRKNVIKNSTDPRMLARIARSVDRGEVSESVAKRVTQRLIHDRDYSISNAFSESAEHSDFEHATEQIAERLIGRLEDQVDRAYEVGPELRETLVKLSRAISRALKS
jgi:ParB family transcriptional regulator, chromosome partitioning protein